MFEKHCLISRILFDSPVYSSPLLRTNNSTNIRKKSTTFLSMTIGARISCLMKKPEAKNLVRVSLLLHFIHLVRPSGRSQKSFCGVPALHIINVLRFRGFISHPWSALSVCFSVSLFLCLLYKL